MSLSEYITELQQTADKFQNIVNELRLFDKTPDNYTNLDMLLTRKEAAEFLSKSERQLDRLCDCGRIQREDVNGRIRIRKSELIRFMGFDVDCRKERLGGE